MSKLLAILQQVAAGTITPEEAEREIQTTHWLVGKGKAGEPINCDAVGRETPSVRAVKVTREGTFYEETSESIIFSWLPPRPYGVGVEKP